MDLKSYELRKSRRQLFEAIKNNDTVKTTKILDNFPDIDFIQNGKSALGLAIQSKSTDMTSLLLEKKTKKLDSLKDENGNTFLNLAVISNSPDIVHLLLEANCDPDISNDKGLTPLHNSVLLGNVEIVRNILSKTSFVNKCDLRGETPLFICSKNGKCDLLKLLLEAGCDINWKDSERKTALIVAVEENQPSIVLSLIKAGCDLNASDNYGRTSLLYAAKLDNVNILKILLLAGADIEHCDTRGFVPFCEAVLGLHIDIIKELIKSGCDINVTKFELSQTALHRCINRASSIFGDYQKEILLSRILIGNKCKLNVFDDVGNCPLYFAAIRGQVDLVKILIENGADVNSMNKNQESLLHASVAGNQLELVNRFIEAGCDVNQTNSQNEIPLYWSINLKSNILIIQRLIKAGSNLNICEKKSNQTAIHRAVHLGYLEAVRALLQAGCNPNITNHLGGSPLLAACQIDNYEIAKTLLTEGNKYALDVNQGYTLSPIHAACQISSLDIVKLLLQSKCDVNKLTNIGKSSLFYSCEQNNLPISYLLVMAGANPSSHHRLPKRISPCCSSYSDPHPHLELEPFLGALEHDNFKVIKLLMLASPRAPYDVLRNVRDIVFRTNYAREAKLSKQKLLIYKLLLDKFLTGLNSLKAMCRGIVRERLGCYPADKIKKLPGCPEILKDYLLLPELNNLCSE